MINLLYQPPTVAHRLDQKYHLQQMTLMYFHLYTN
nr:MAG TPA: hypothetical protein [Caudoviricetes sp.]